MRNEIIVFLLSLCVYLFLKYQKSILEKDTLTKIQSKILVSGFGTPTLLFAVLFIVLWFNDHKLGWYSYMTRDWWTFGAFVIAYIVFAPAFMKEKDKTKKVPIFKKMMVLVTIIAVILAFTDGIKNPFAGGTHETEAAVPDTAPPVARTVPQRQVHKLVATNDKFVYQEIPDGANVESFCPDGTIRDFVYDGMPPDNDDLLDCDAPGRGEDLGNGKTGRRIGFISKSEAPTHPTVTIVSIVN